MARVLRVVSPTQLALLVALAVSGTGLYFDLRPEKRPVAAAKVSASLAVLRVERSVPYGEYLQLRARDLRAFARAPKNQRLVPVDVVYVEAQIDGLRGRKTDFRWWLYDGDGRRVRVDELDVYRRVTSKQATLSDKFVLPIWVKLPKKPGRYFVRVELYVQDVLLAMADSPRFGNES